MKRFKVKFFGAKQERHEQIKQIKIVIDADSIEEVKTLLRQKYAVINRLKIREIKDEEE